MGRKQWNPVARAITNSRRRTTRAKNKVVAGLISLIALFVLPIACFNMVCRRSSAPPGSSSTHGTPTPPKPRAVAAIPVAQEAPPPPEEPTSPKKKRKHRPKKRPKVGARQPEQLSEPAPEKVDDMDRALEAALKDPGSQPAPSSVKATPRSSCCKVCLDAKELRVEVSVAHLQRSCNEATVRYQSDAYATLRGRSGDFSKNRNPLETLKPHTIRLGPLQKAGDVRKRHHQRTKSRILQDVSLTPHGTSHYRLA